MLYILRSIFEKVLIILIKYLKLYQERSKFTFLLKEEALVEVEAIEATAVEIGTEIVEGAIGTAATVTANTAVQMQDPETSATLTVSLSSSLSHSGSKDRFSAKFSSQM